MAVAATKVIVDGEHVQAAHVGPSDAAGADAFQCRPLVALVLCHAADQAERVVGVHCMAQMARVAYMDGDNTAVE